MKWNEMNSLIFHFSVFKIDSLNPNKYFLFILISVEVDQKCAMLV